MMRKIIALLSLLAFSAGATTFNANYTLSDLTTRPSSVIKVTMTPLQPFVNYAGTILDSRDVVRVTSTNGTCTFSNVVAGYDYRLTVFLTGGSSPSFTNGFPEGLTGEVNGADYIGVRVGQIFYFAGATNGSVSVSGKVSKTGDTMTGGLYNNSAAGFVGNGSGLTGVVATAVSGTITNDTTGNAATATLAANATTAATATLATQATSLSGSINTNQVNGLTEALAAKSDPSTVATQIASSNLVNVTTLNSSSNSLVTQIGVKAGTNIANLTQVGLVDTNDFSLFNTRAFNHTPFKTPVMGVGTWPLWGAAATEDNVTNLVWQLKTEGWRDYGYKTIKLSDGWAGGRTNSATGTFYWWNSTNQMFLSNGVYVADVPGVLVADTNKYPHGLSWIINYIHTNGFMIDLFHSLGQASIGGMPGSANHEFQDATNHMALGVDSFRIVVDDQSFDIGDNVFTAGGQDNYHRYRKFLSGLQSGSRPYHVTATTYQLQGWMKPAMNSLVYGTNYPGTDLIFFDPSGYQTNTLAMTDFWYDRRQWIEPGSYFTGEWMPPGRDMNGNLNVESYKTILGLHALLSCDFFMENYTYAPFQSVISNKALIAIDQDVLVAPPSIVASNATMQAWAKPLKQYGSGNFALGFLNRSLTAWTTNLTVDWTNIGLPYGSYLVKDVWAGTYSINTSNSISVSSTNDTLKLFTIEPWDAQAVPVNSYAYSSYGIAPAVANAVISGISYYNIPVAADSGFLTRWLVPAFYKNTGNTIIVDTTILCTNRAPWRFQPSLTCYLRSGSGQTVYLPGVNLSGTNSASGIFHATSVFDVSGIAFDGGFFALLGMGDNTNTLHILGLSAKRL